MRNVCNSSRTICEMNSRAERRRILLFGWFIGENGASVKERNWRTYSARKGPTVSSTHILSLCILSCLFANSFIDGVSGQSREEIVRGDRERVEAEGFWMYNDIPGAIEKAEETGKPIVVVLRCLPCHECVKLDDELVDTDPVIRPLLEQFVCVRQVGTNGLDLKLFQFDTDQSFAVFMLNADKTIYGRFGTRSHRTDWIGDVSLKGLAAALQGALELHGRYDQVKASLSGKTGPAPEVPSPEKYPSLKDKFTNKLDYEGDVVKSCIHCHQIGDAQREFYWRSNRPIPDKVLYPYPHPKVVGLIIDPEKKATVKDVVPGTSAATAGIQAGDEIVSFNGQPMLSIADIQWVLHGIDPQGDSVPVSVIRDSKPMNLQLKVEDGWRREGDLSWRVTSWGLRRMATGGMVLEEASDALRAKAGIDDGKMALLVKRVGKYGPHATAKKSGFKEGDVIVGFDQQDELLTEQALHTYVVTQKRPGTRVGVSVVRNARRIDLKLPLQP